MKMEGIELYPHNQKAYDNLCAMLRDSNRACVVQPTGTGKFVIIAKMAQDNPGKNFLLLGTNDYMYIDQMANLSVRSRIHSEESAIYDLCNRNG